MQDLSPDMEDLLRRASETYPLKQGEDKWNEIALKILQSQSKQRLWWRYKKQYSLVLLFGLLFSFLVLNNTQNQNNGIAQYKMKYPSKPTLADSDDDAKTVHRNQINPTVILADKKTKKDITIHSTASNKLKRQTSFTKLFDEQKNRPNQPGKVSEPARDNFPYPYFSTESFIKQLSSKQLTGNQSEVALILNKEKENTGTGNNSKSNKLIKKGIYYGAIAGLHLNAIQDQGFKKTGFDLGVIAGHQFSAKLSLETGILFAKKFYWTRGKYFNTVEMKSAMPTGMEVLEVHGSSRFIQVPIHLRYNLVSKTSHRIYSSAGISSYIITNENNEYHTLYNGTEAEMSGTYKKNRNYFAATIDIGLGYEKDFGKNSQLRLEPYLQLPVRGLGIGQLSVKTAGFRIAITRSAR